MDERDAQERQALIDDIINNLTGGAPTEMRITVDLDAEIIRVAPPDCYGIETDFSFTVDCAGTCRMTFALAMRRSDHELWRSGSVVVQQCFPYITPPFRELLITKLCPACWREMFNTSEDEGQVENGNEAEQRPSAVGRSAAEAIRLAEHDPRSLDRAVLLFKDDLISLLRIAQDASRIRFIYYIKGRRARPFVRLFQNTERGRRAAQAQFQRALAVILSRGWRIGYDGPVLLG